MRVAIIGNNDGPERLAGSLRRGGHEVVFCGRQRGAGPQEPSYGEESSLRTALAPLDFDLLLNCFANFRFRHLLDEVDCLNVHLAPLPRYRGRHPLRWALINGETEFGATLHRMNAEFDAGAILWQRLVPVGTDWSARQLREALFATVETELPAVLHEYAAGRLRELPNDDRLATNVTRRSPTDSLLDARDWADHARLRRKVMALREDDHPAVLLTADGARYPLSAARPGVRTFVGFGRPVTVGRRERAIEVVCADGATLWLSLAPAAPPPPPPNTPLNIPQ